MRNVEGFYFGADSGLFGMFHTATGFPRDHAVVLCAPLFHEYYRSHFVLKKIAIDLAEDGYDVLRFDYSGTGDSKGEPPAETFEQWSEDIGTAIKEIRGLTGHATVSLVATRFAVSLGLPWYSELTNFICWDPVLDCDRYREDIDTIHRAAVGEHMALSAADEATLRDTDYLGTGIPRETILADLVQFGRQHRREGPTELPDRCTTITSETNWLQPHLETVFAHDAIRQVKEAF